MVVLLLVVAVLAGLTAICTKKGGGPSGRRAVALDVFRAGVVRPSTLDPAKARTVDELLVADQLFDSLTAADPETLAPVPSLAASWTASADQQHWDFTLRSTARFSDGSTVTSTDVKATLERIAKKDSGSSVSDLLEPVTGYRAVAVDGVATELTGVVAVSPTVVHVDLDAPWSALPSVLSNPAFGVLPKAVLDAGAELSGVPVTSGPFVVAAQAGDRLTLTPAKGVSTKSKRVEFALFADKAAAFDAMVAGEVDWSGVPADRVEEAAKKFGRSQFRPYVAELFYAFNLRDAKFADIRVREAIVRAVDRSAIVRDVYGDTVTATDSLVVDGLEGHQDHPCSGKCDVDTARSKELVDALAAEGVPVPPLQLDFEDDATQLAVATAIQKSLADVGIVASLRPKPLAEYQQFAVSGAQEIFRLGWIAPYPSADAILAPLFLTGSPNNLTGFSSAPVDEQLRLARSSADAAARVAAYQAAETAILAELPIIPIGQFELQSVASSRVRGLTMTAAGSFDGRRVWVANR
ncbi:MAG TPA: ABC transporter substrate-binding protein [Acidimicrobiales bacterium]|nr:ABC transporter substrate-binding protein [Acidimicrobiales bacterium]